MCNLLFGDMNHLNTEGLGTTTDILLSTTSGNVSKSQKVVFFFPKCIISTVKSDMIFSSFAMSKEPCFTVEYNLRHWTFPPLLNGSIQVRVQLETVFQIWSPYESTTRYISLAERHVERDDVILRYQPCVTQTTNESNETYVRVESASAVKRNIYSG